MMRTILVDWFRRGAGLFAAPFLTNQNEQRVPPYTLPTPHGVGRAELLELFKKELYGTMPDVLPEIQVQLLEEGSAFKDTAYRKQFACTFSRDEASVVLNVLLYLPKGVAKAPALLCANFNGNHSLTTDTKVFGTNIWSKHIAGFRIPFRETMRGMWAHRFPVENIVARGYAAATFYYGDADPDYNDGFKNGVHALFPELQGREDNFATLGAWAWSMSCVMDVLTQEPAIDTSRIALYGFSRLGKSALWAAANDERFAAVIADGSGKAGASLSSRMFGETLSLMHYRFPYWFPRGFVQFLRSPQSRSVDQHVLLSLINPRPLLLISGKEDWWSDPQGTHLALSEALRITPSYKALWLECARRHDPRVEDWNQYLDFLDSELR